MYTATFMCINFNSFYMNTSSIGSLFSVRFSRGLLIFLPCFGFLRKKALFSWKNFVLRFSCQDTQNYVKCLKRDLENMPGCAPLCVKTSENSSFFIWGIIRPARVEIWCAPKAYATLPLILFSFELIHRLGCYNDLNFLINMSNRFGYC